MAAAERNNTFQELCARAAGLMESNRIRMPRDQAVQAGCIMLGEAVVFSLTSAVLVHEYGRSKEAERQKGVEAREEVRREAQAGRDELARAVVALEARAKEVLSSGGQGARSMPRAPEQPRGPLPVPSQPQSLP
uniref:OPA3-like protein n=1 Tax=Alexandrium catenella TaxID=2925 RepID=A0A7S1QSK3_ALECA